MVAPGGMDGFTEFFWGVWHGFARVYRRDRNARLYVDEVVMRVADSVGGAYHGVEDLGFPPEVWSDIDSAAAESYLSKRRDAAGRWS